MRLCGFCLCWGALLVSVSPADVIYFKSGDRLSGKILTIQGQKMILESAEAGKVTLDLNRVESFETEEPADFHLQDGSILKARAEREESGYFVMVCPPEGVSQKKAISDVKAVNPPVPAKPRWKGNLAAGYASFHGNTYYENANISSELTRRRDIDRIRMHSLYMVTRARNSSTKEEFTTQESFFGDGKYDYFLTKQFYSYLHSSYKKDHIADLDHRIILGPGVGYQWFESDTMNLSTDAGFAQIFEQYSPPSGTTYNDEVSFQFGWHFDRKLNSRFTVFHNLNYFPGITHFSDYYLSADAELRAKITEKIFTSLKTLLDYDSTPSQQATTDTKYFLNLGWNF